MNQPDSALAERVIRLLGRRISAWVRIRGGYTPAERWVVRDNATASSFFVKKGSTPQTAELLRREIRAYERIQGDFLPTLIGWEDHETLPILIIEDLYPAEFDQWMKTFLDRMRGKTNPSASSKEAEEQHGVSVSELAANDGRQAVRYIRTHANKWGLAPDRVGMIGFSAGAYITLATVMDHDPDSRLDFAAVIYGGVIEGRNPPANAPPLFLVVAQDDQWTFTRCQKLYAEWNTARLPVEFHSFAQGGHGFGMLKQGLPADHWIDLFAYWLDSLGLMKRGDTPHKSPMFEAPKPSENGKR